jgi:phosphoserine phosphatase
MNIINYSKYNDFVLLKNNFNLSSKLKDLDFAIFDFDGTLYPGMILLDLAEYTFSKNIYKLSKLNNIKREYNSGLFVESYKNFLDLLNGEEKGKLSENANFILDRCYPNGIEFVNKLTRKYNLKCKLVSLTADFIADLVMKRYGFVEVSAINYSTKIFEGIEYFTGLSNDKIIEPSDLKKNLFLKLSDIKKSSKFIYFCDSLDDVKILEDAYIKVAINPNNKISELIEFDLIVKDFNDPWIHLKELI